jgi:hypothetical protein
MESAGVAELAGLSTGHLNQLAARTTTTRGVVASSPISSQVIDLYRDIKSSEGSGGRRKSLVFYSLESAMELISRRAEATEERSAVIEDAFAAAEQLVDTNPFRHEHRRLVRNRLALKEQIAAAELEGMESES